ncbi:MULTISPECIES: ABC transporter permease [Glycomyces]|uniref:ABC transporter permease subunit n=2 Tax=Glycomyces TaxID=58113 RepID=A0A9X3SXD2_9ACTN|nr:ABC transporter permease subunit [Glycomyces lechevalierae]MDA1384976.1 ABC transporter permease subunit [Glycomyces lechevalierae]MDR7337572.1 glycine betaine/proline transport system permease protein [Glycomyces lechevalierae]
MIEYLRNWFWTYIWKPLPDMPFGDWMETFIRWARDAWATGFDAVDTALEFLYLHLADGLLWLPSGVMVLLFAAAAWAAKGWKLGVGIGIGMFVVAWTPYWEQTMQTLSMVLVSAAIAILLAIPLGIAAAESKAVSAIARPVLDFMQTLPAFVYLIPVVMLFSVGVVPGIIATIIFAMPPGVRLTELGLRQVDREVVEAGQAFGASPGRILARIKLPLALPTIMAGLNQVIMLALSMVVIAGLVGGGGLGSVISGSLGRLDIAAGFNAGLAVVLLAILLDRVTQGLSDRTPVARAAKLAR